MPDLETEKVEVTPFKQFFISVLTRDIEIIDTIPEFVDNSIDGAERVNGGGDLSEFEVDLSIGPNELRIVDNCGGIPQDRAKNYAFRFGRPTDESARVESLIGEFGVGMKRALFKLANHFVVESKTTENHFRIDVEVSEWVDSDDWKFEMEILPDDEEDPRYDLTEPGTRIEIDDLTEQAESNFEDELFVTRVKNKLASKNSSFLERGLDIAVNREPVHSESISLRESDDLNIAHKNESIPYGEGNVDVELIAGLGDRSNDEAGWYVFCNGRLVLEADQSDDTGWGNGAIPKYHPEFNRFRGIVNFVSDDPGALPWNTTKTDINTDDPVYQKAKQEMGQVMRPIIDTLNDIADEKSEKGDSTIEQKVDDASSVDVNKMESDDEEEFEGPDVDEDAIEDTSTIQYSKPTDEVEELKDYLEVSTNKEVGQKTFDYYYKYEIEGEF